MDMEEKHIEVRRTARYFCYGNPSGKTKRVWFLLHGYGMLASSLLKRFASFDPETDYLIAPEGLSKFYWDGFGGKRVASWMTSEDRLNEIKDYVNYLNELHHKIWEDLKESSLERDNVELNVLGFSQGTATAARWLAEGKVVFDHLVFWAGPLPEDVDWDATKPIFNACKSATFFHGSEDPFIKKEHILNHEKKLKAMGLQFELIDYEGGHEIVKDGLEKLWKKILAPV